MAWTTPEDFTAGQVLTADSMDAISQNIVALQGARRIAHLTTATSYTVNQTALASASNVFATSATITPPSGGTGYYRVEFYCPRVQLPAGTAAICTIRLYNSGGSVDLGTIAELKNNAAVTFQTPVMAVVPLTLAAQTVLNIRSIYTTTSGPVLGAGSAGSAQLHNMTMSVFGTFEGA